VLVTELSRQILSNMTLNQTAMPKCTLMLWSNTPQFSLEAQVTINASTPFLSMSMLKHRTLQV